MIYLKWRMAIIVRAASVSDTLKSNLGASSKGVENEDDWLRNVLNS